MNASVILDHKELTLLIINNYNDLLKQTSTKGTMPIFATTRRVILATIAAIGVAFAAPASASVPWGIEFNSGVTKIGGSNLTTCVISNGALKCWGHNFFGQVGDGSQLPIQYTPATIIEQGVTAVAGRDLHTCAVVAGAVKCWGNNDSGQLGTGDLQSSLIPINTLVNSGATEVTTGLWSTCAIINGAAKCWGDNGFGQLGDGTGMPSTVPATAVPAGVVAISSGSFHACAIIGSSLKCWGANDYGQLGIGALVNSKTPVTVFEDGVTAVATGDYHTCAIVNGAVQCWGSNNSGQIGDGSNDNRLSPVTIIASGATALSASLVQTCAIVDNALQCWGQTMDADENFNSNYLSPRTIRAHAESIHLSSFATRVLASGALECVGDCYPIRTIDFNLPDLVLGSPEYIDGPPSWLMELTSLTPDTCTIAENMATPVAVGTCTVVGRDALDIYMRAAEPVTKHVLVRQSQSISFAEILLPASEYKVGATITLVATASSGLPVTFASAFPDLCSVSGDVVSILAGAINGSRHCKVYATQQGNMQYAAAPAAARFVFPVP